MERQGRSGVKAASGRDQHQSEQAQTKAENGENGGRHGRTTQGGGSGDSTRDADRLLLMSGMKVSWQWKKGVGWSSGGSFFPSLAGNVCAPG